LFGFKPSSVFWLKSRFGLSLNGSQRWTRKSFWGILFLLALILSLYLGGCLFQEKPLVIAVSVGIDKSLDSGLYQAFRVV